MSFVRQGELKHQLALGLACSVLMSGWWESCHCLRVPRLFMRHLVSPPSDSDIERERKLSAMLRTRRERGVSVSAGHLPGLGKY